MEEHYLLSLFVFIIFGVVFSKKEKNAVSTFTPESYNSSNNTSSGLSGVAKYLESKVEAKPSGVAKYLENKQSIENSQKKEQKVSGVAKYLASKNEAPISSVSKYMARKAIDTKGNS